MDDYLKMASYAVGPRDTGGIQITPFMLLSRVLIVLMGDSSIILDHNQFQVLDDCSNCVGIGKIMQRKRFDEGRSWQYQILLEEYVGPMEMHGTEDNLLWVNHFEIREVL
jgi:hypothetical protein